MRYPFRTLFPVLCLLLPLPLASAGDTPAATAPATQPAAQPGHAGVTNSVGIKLVRIPAGEFVMGTPANEQKAFNSSVQRPVKLTQAFMMSTTEVTRAQFAAFVEATGYKTDAETDGKGALGAVNGADAVNLNWQNPGIPQAPDHPVVCISWNDAKAYCVWLSKREGKTYRLPTEAEWEYACRAGTTTVYSSGDTLDDLKKVAWASYGGKFDSAGTTAKTGSLAPNAWGLYDMHGTACEWCEDWFGEIPAEPAKDPIGPGNGKSHVIRGGGWSGQLRTLTAAYRMKNEPMGPNSLPRQRNVFGFRVVRVEIEPVAGK